MRPVYLLLCVILLSVITGCNSNRDNENVMTQGQGYGAGFDSALPVKSIAFALSAPEALDQSFTFEGTIALQCANDGCWFNLSDGEDEIRVNLRPAGFVLPQLSQPEVKVSGKVVRVGDAVEIQATGVTVY